MLYYKTIDSPTLELLMYILKIPEFKNLRLVGGTALAFRSAIENQLISIFSDNFASMNMRFLMH